MCVAAERAQERACQERSNVAGRCHRRATPTEHGRMGRRALARHRCASPERAARAKDRVAPVMVGCLRGTASTPRKLTYAAVPRLAVRDSFHQPDAVVLHVVEVDLTTRARARELSGCHCGLGVTRTLTAKGVGQEAVRQNWGRVGPTTTRGGTMRARPVVPRVQLR